MIKLNIICTLILLSGCIGTDFVDEPLGPVPSRIEFAQRSINLIEGSTQQLDADVIASDGNAIDVMLSWASRDPAVATIDDEGLLTAIAAGQVWIDVSAQILKDSLLVTISVDPDALASITITSSRTNLIIGDTLQLRAMAQNANGNIMDINSISWFSEDSTVCTVDNTGLVVALSNGRTQITAISEGISSLPYAIMVGGEDMTRSGMFMGLNGYSVSGTATLQLSADGNTLLLGSDFSSQNGPGLFVYLSPNANNVTGGVNLGSLKSASGSQTYEIPDSVDPSDFDHAIIYCQPFSVPFGTAQLQ